MESNMLSSLFLLLMLISSATPTEESPSMNQDLVTATKEMQKANYFTFVMLINMSPPDTRLEENITFLMPNDRMLASMVLQQGSILGFLLRHSIPSPLLFDTLRQFPTGTTIPSSLPNCMLKISNNGRKNFVINNVRIISPNICVAGSSIRCHGIDGVLSENCVSSMNNSSVPPPPLLCPNGTDPFSCKTSPPIPSPSLPSTPPSSTSDQNISPPPALMAPSPVETSVGPVKSGAPQWLSFHGSSSLNFMAWFLLSVTTCILL